VLNESIFWILNVGQGSNRKRPILHICRELSTPTRTGGVVRPGGVTAHQQLRTSEEKASSPNWVNYPLGRSKTSSPAVSALGWRRYCPPDIMLQLLFTLRASEAAAQCNCNRFCLWVCVCVCASVTTITRYCVHRSSPNWVWSQR